VLALACVIVSVLATACWSAKEDTAKLEELKAVWARLPIYPGMQEVGDSTRSGGGTVLVGKKFRSDARYDDVKSFYVEHLTKDGWEVISDRKLADWGGDPERYYIQFHKGDIFLSIEYAGDGSDRDWQYAIALNWSRWTRKK
jgi:hypothetical protein